MERKTGTPLAAASSKAASPHGHQSTGLWACWRRYGLFSSARRLVCSGVMRACRGQDLNGAATAGDPSGRYRMCRTIRRSVPSASGAMPRLLLLLALPLALAACTPDLPPEAAREAAEAAAARGEAREAIRYYKAAAADGDLYAAADRGQTYEDGYLRVRTSTHDAPAHPPAPRPGRRWRQKYERERDERARSGDPAAWMLVADDLVLWNRDRTPATADSALAIRQRLAAEGYGPALIVRRVRPPPRETLPRPTRFWPARRPLATPGLSCPSYLLAHRSSQSDSPRRRSRTPSTHRSLPASPGGLRRAGERTIRGLRAAGTPEAAANLDSLRTLGVFERHPRLARI